MTPTSSPEANRAFEELGLEGELVDTLSSLGYEEPTPIQRETIPHLLAGRDLLGLAATGTGKTAAFALPLIQRLDRAGREPSVLILVPTRELALQVSQAVHRYGRARGVRVLPIYGGQPFHKQLAVLKRGVDVVVATPGRALDHLRRRTLDLDRLEAIVLDEADEMLDMGFAEDIEGILAETPAGRQTLLFSATIAPRIESIAARHLRDPVEVRLADLDSAEVDEPRVREIAYLVARSHKVAALGRVLDVEGPDAALIFCRTRNDVDELAEALNGRGHRAEALHGGMSQDERERVMKRLRGGAVDLLVATDVAARGLDISHLTHVVNFDVPSEPRAYVHRIGRVGRAGREGVAITLATPRERTQLRNIERLRRRRIAVESLPTVADLKAHRLELTRAALRESLVEGGLDRFRVVVESLSDEFDLFDVAAAAIKTMHEATVTGSDEDEEEIPQARPERGPSQRGKRTAPRPRTDHPATGFTRIFFGIGREAGVGPKDLVGAIAGEARIAGKSIGAIQISERFSLVEVDGEVAEQVVHAMRRAKIRGKKVTVRPDRGR